MPFIVGVPRSGTTLLRLMLDAHPELCIPPETHFLPGLLKLGGETAGTCEPFFRAVTEFETWDDFNLSADEFARVLKEIDPFVISEGVRAFYRLYAARFGKKRWGDKTPPYSLFLREVESILPEAHFIHLIRDGRDVALSVRKLWFAPGRDIETIARDWCSRIQTARAGGKECRSNLEIRYEDLVRNPIEQLKKICAFLGLDYHSNMETYYHFSQARLSEVKSRYRSDGTLLISKEERLFNQRFTNFPPDRSRIFRWKREMEKRDLLEFERIAGKTLEELGYEITSPKSDWING